MRNSIRLYLSLLIVLLLSPAANSVPATEDVFTGKVTAVEDDSFTVEHANNKDVTIIKKFFFTENTKFYYEGEKVEQDFLGEEDSVTVKFIEENGRLVALEVTIGTEEFDYDEEEPGL